jgi:type IV secretion system protein VirB6
MSAGSCQYAIEAVGSGVAASLHGVDCAASQMAEAAFGRLFGTQGALIPALTALLTIYVALFAFALITGRSRIGVSALTPRFISLGLVLTFATSWIAYQSVVWNLAVGGPNELASLLTGTTGNATTVFAQKIDIILQRLNEVSGNGIAPSSTFSPLGLMWLGGALFLLGTVGVLATSRIALAVLLVLGPIFVVLALFQGTRGLFVGWLRGVVMLALAPLFAVLSGSFMLKLAVPVLSTLAPVMPGQIAPTAAMAFFLLGAVHVALMILVTKVAATIVSGWNVFGLARASDMSSGSSSAPGHAEPPPTTVRLTSDPARHAATRPARQIRLADSPSSAVSEDAMASRGGRRVPVSLPAAAAPLSRSAGSRARGVGSRFRAPQDRRLEKFK